MSVSSDHGWIMLHPSGAYLIFTQAGGGPVRLVNVRFASHNGLKSDIVPCPKRAKRGSRVACPSRALRRCHQETQK